MREVKLPLRTVLENFINHVDTLESQKDKGNDQYELQFQDLKQFTEGLKSNPEYSCFEGEKDVNRKKNRYKDILPYDKTRVTLSSVDGVEGADYINANYVQGATGCKAYIASQGPLPNTVSDFWQMVVECNVHVIIMASNETEGGKHKCECYWVSEGDEDKKFGKFTVSYIKSCQHCPDFLVRTLKVTYINSSGNTEERTVSQFHYFLWPDHGVPDTVRPLLDMVRKVRECLASETWPVLVHCSAGCGRTGTICAIDYVLGLLRMGLLTENLDLHGLVKDMRRQRVAMVQTKEQYILLHRTLKELFKDHLLVMDSHPYENVSKDGTPLLQEVCSDYEELQVQKRPPGDFLLPLRDDFSSLVDPLNNPKFVSKQSDLTLGLKDWSGSFLSTRNMKPSSLPTTPVVSPNCILYPSNKGYHTLGSLPPKSSLNSSKLPQNQLETDFSHRHAKMPPINSHLYRTSSGSLLLKSEQHMLPSMSALMVHSDSCGSLSTDATFPIFPHSMKSSLSTCRKSGEQVPSQQVLDYHASSHFNVLAPECSWCDSPNATVSLVTESKKFDNPDSLESECTRKPFSQKTNDTFDKSLLLDRVSVKLCRSASSVTSGSRLSIPKPVEKKRKGSLDFDVDDMTTNTLAGGKNIPVCPIPPADLCLNNLCDEIHDDVKGKQLSSPVFSDSKRSIHTHNEPVSAAMSIDVGEKLETKPALPLKKSKSFKCSRPSFSPPDNDFLIQKSDSCNSTFENISTKKDISSPSSLTFSIKNNAVAGYRDTGDPAFFDARPLVPPKKIIGERGRTLKPPVSLPLKENDQIYSLLSGSEKTATSCTLSPISLTNSLPSNKQSGNAVCIDPRTTASVDFRVCAPPQYPVGKVPEVHSDCHSKYSEVSEDSSVSSLLSSKESPDVRHAKDYVNARIIRTHLADSNDHSYTYVPVPTRRVTREKAHHYVNHPVTDSQTFQGQEDDSIELYQKPKFNCSAEDTRRNCDQDRCLKLGKVNYNLNKRSGIHQKSNSTSLDYEPVDFGETTASVDEVFETINHELITGKQKHDKQKDFHEKLHEYYSESNLDSIAKQVYYDCEQYLLHGTSKSPIPTLMPEVRNTESSDLRDSHSQSTVDKIKNKVNVIPQGMRTRERRYSYKQAVTSHSCSSSRDIPEARRNIHKYEKIWFGNNQVKKGKVFNHEAVYCMKNGTDSQNSNNEELDYHINSLPYQKLDFVTASLGYADDDETASKGSHSTNSTLQSRSTQSSKSSGPKDSRTSVPNLIDSSSVSKDSQENHFRAGRSHNEKPTFNNTYHTIATSRPLMRNYDEQFDVLNTSQKNPPLVGTTTTLPSRSVATNNFPGNINAARVFRSASNVASSAQVSSDFVENHEGKENVRLSFRSSELKNSEIHPDLQPDDSLKSQTNLSLYSQVGASKKHVKARKISAVQGINSEGWKGQPQQVLDSVSSAEPKKMPVAPPRIKRNSSILASQKYNEISPPYQFKGHEESELPPFNGESLDSPPSVNTLTQKNATPLLKSPYLHPPPPKPLKQMYMFVPNPQKLMSKWKKSGSQAFSSGDRVRGTSSRKQRHGKPPHKTLVSTGLTTDDSASDVTDDEGIFHKLSAPNVFKKLRAVNLMRPACNSTADSTSTFYTKDKEIGLQNGEEEEDRVDGTGLTLGRCDGTLSSPSSPKMFLKAFGKLRSNSKSVAANFKTYLNIRKEKASDEGPSSGFCLQKSASSGSGLQMYSQMIGDSKFQEFHRKGGLQDTFSSFPSMPSTSIEDPDMPYQHYL